MTAQLMELSLSMARHKLLPELILREAKDLVRSVEFDSIGGVTQPDRVVGSYLMTAQLMELSLSMARHKLLPELILREAKDLVRSVEFDSIGGVTQPDRVVGSYPICHWFKSSRRHFICMRRIPTQKDQPPLSFYLSCCVVVLSDRREGA